MVRFSVSLNQKASEIDGELCLLGSIHIGDFTEKFHSPLNHWGREQYLAQWKEGLTRIENGANSSAIVTRMYDPKFAKFIFWWAFYRLGDQIRAQEQLVLFDNLESGFDESDIYSSIRERETETDDGYKISEWKLDPQDVSNFLELQPF